MNSIKNFVSDIAPAVLFILVVVALFGGLVFWGAYDMHYRDKWAREAQQAKYEAERAAEEAARKAEVLADLQRFADGGALYGDAKEIVEQEAARQLHYPRENPKPVWDEVYDIVPGLTAPDLSFENEPTPTIEVYRKRASAFLEKHRKIYQKGDGRQLSFEEYLRIDRKELHWLSEMGGRLNDEVLGRLETLLSKAPLLKDGVAIARFAHFYSSGQHGLTANVVGYNPNDHHGEFGNAVASIFAAGGFDYDVRLETSGGIHTSPESSQEQAAQTHTWGTVRWEKGFTWGVSHQAISMDPPVLCDLAGRIVCVQIGKENLRVTFYDSTGKPDATKLAEPLRRLANLVGVQIPEGYDAPWKQIDETTTWDLSLKNG